MGEAGESLVDEGDGGCGRRGSMRRARALPVRRRCRQRGCDDRTRSWAVLRTSPSEILVEERFSGEGFLGDATAVWLSRRAARG